MERHFVFRLLVTNALLPFLRQYAAGIRFHIPQAFRVNREIFMLLTRHWFFASSDGPETRILSRFWRNVAVNLSSLSSSSWTYQLEDLQVVSASIMKPSWIERLHFPDLLRLRFSNRPDCVGPSNMQGRQIFLVESHLLPRRGVSCLIFECGSFIQRFNLQDEQFAHLTQLQVQMEATQLNQIASLLVALENLSLDLLLFPALPVSSWWPESPEYLLLEWPPCLINLEIHRVVFQSVLNLDHLPPTLKKLRIDSEVKVVSLDHLPVSLEILHLKFLSNHLDHLPSRLHTLIIRNCQLTSFRLDHLPSSLRHLTLPSSLQIPLDHLPSPLRNLIFIIDHVHGQVRTTPLHWLPASLEVFEFRVTEQEIDAAQSDIFPDPLTHLPINVQHLTLSMCFQFSSGLKFDHLSRLSTLRLLEIPDLPPLPSLPLLRVLQLDHCNFSCSHALLPEFPSLHSLTIACCHHLIFRLGHLIELTSLCLTSIEEDQFMIESWPANLLILNLNISCPNPTWPSFPLCLESLLLASHTYRFLDQMNFWDGVLGDLTELFSLRQLMIRSPMFRQTIHLPPQLEYLEVCHGAIAQISGSCPQLRHAHVCHPNSSFSSSDHRRVFQAGQNQNFYFPSSMNFIPLVLSNSVQQCHFKKNPPGQRRRMT